MKRERRERGRERERKREGERKRGRERDMLEMPNFEIKIESWGSGDMCIALPTNPELVFPFLGLLASVLVLSDDPSCWSILSITSLFPG